MSSTQRGRCGSVLEPYPPLLTLDRRAVGCSSTRQRFSFACINGEPPSRREIAKDS